MTPQDLKWLSDQNIGDPPGDLPSDPAAFDAKAARAMIEIHRIAEARLHAELRVLRDTHALHCGTLSQQIQERNHKIHKLGIKTDRLLLLLAGTAMLAAWAVWRAQHGC